MLHQQERNKWLCVRVSCDDVVRSTDGIFYIFETVLCLFLIDAFNDV